MAHMYKLLRRIFPKFGMVMTAGYNHLGYHHLDHLGHYQGRWGHRSAEHKSQ